MIIKVKPITAINNDPDTNGMGGVPYAFYISESPISNSIYCEFLNSIPKSFSPLYNLTKPQNINAFKKKFQSEIIYEKRKFIPANSLIGQFPITNISYTDMRSFVLWLNKIDSKQSYYIPTLNEWYKAAYYDPENKLYSNFPNRTNNIETVSPDPTDLTSMSVNNVLSRKMKNKYYIYNYSFFNIRDMGGNIYEMIEKEGPYCIIAGSSWNRDKMNAHKNNCGSRSINKKYYDHYIGFRVCKKIKPITYYISLHNEFGDGWKGDSISLYDTNHGIISKNITLEQNYSSNLIKIEFFNITDNLLILEYHSHNHFFYENSIKLYDSNQNLVHEYHFKKQNDKTVIDLPINHNQLL